MPHSAGPSITAVLGPTNTGKTFLAMDRLLGHPTGMIGFPLRLLARENYERAVKIKGAAQVALITGEEKIIPPGAKYFICTVESMPIDRDVSFLAVDEIQLAADRDRGHVFTDRLLHARGKMETMFLGAETIRPLLRQLVPDAVFETRPRFSKLTYSGRKKLTRLPRRSAVVAFSASEVYGIADLIRRQRGGAAVVMGALSPRTRNAQVELYQSGEVDYIVATDAIGMGLNMDVDHVAFASLAKFDGRAPRSLTAPELSQIAGRAGRHMNDGTFGTTADATGIDPDDLSRIESHTFQPLKMIHWRNTDLRFVTIQALVQGLKKSAPKPGLVRPPVAEDQLVLETLAADGDVHDRAKGAKRVRLLWDVAQVPDFRKLRTEFHSRLLTQVFLHLTDEKERIPEDWVAEQVKRIDRHDGDIHAVMDRIAAIRIWTYLANRPGWVENALDWQGQTRSVEDRLSDTLHEKLTVQFIDRRTAHLVKKLKSDEKVKASIDEDGKVGIDGHFIGEMDGLTFTADKTGLKTADRAVANAANAAVAPELSKRAQEQIAAEDEVFSIDDEGRVIWKGAVVAKLSAGSDPLTPKLEVKADERLDSDIRAGLKTRLEAWLKSHIQSVLPALKEAETAEMSGAARGLMFRMLEGLGTLDRKEAEAQIKALTEEDRKGLARLGVRFGLNALYIPTTLKTPPVRLRAILWNVFAKPEVWFPLPPGGRVSFETAQGVPADFYRACGFRPVKGMAYRVDMIERFSGEVRRLLREKVAVLPPEQLSPLGISAEKAVDLLKALGFIATLSEDGLAIGTRKQNRKPQKQSAKSDKSGTGKSRTGKSKKSRPAKAPTKAKEKPFDPDSPFAKLKDLVVS